MNNLDKGFTRTDLIYTRFQEFGISRDKFKDHFDDYIDSLQEMALEKGYFLEVTSINRNSGTEYRLIKLEEQELGEDTQTLEDLI